MIRKNASSEIVNSIAPGSGVLVLERGFNNNIVKILSFTLDYLKDEL